jgi:hypothetical protein
MDLDGPRGAKRKADALADTAIPRRIKVRRQSLKLQPVENQMGLLSPSAVSCLGPGPRCRQ